MSIIETIQKRRSVRSYTGDYLTDEDAERIRNFISNRVEVPFGTVLRIELIKTEIGSKPRKLGTYGVVSGAADFLAVAYENANMAEESLGYAFEQVILYCTQMGLGTCWMGGTFDHDDFANAINLRENEVLPIISPVGYQRDKKSFVDSIFGKMTHNVSRESFNTLFFNGSWDVPMGENDAGEYKTVLEMVRLAPSARNKQPWRILYKDGVFHFYRHPDMSRFTRIDMGIAMCHFDMACKELGLKGTFDLKNSMPEAFDNVGKMIYTVSWIPLP